MPRKNNTHFKDHDMCLLAGACEALLENTGLGIAILDSNLVYRHINSQLALFNGMSIEDHLGKSVGELLPKIAHLIVPLLNQVLSSGEAIKNFSVSGETPSTEGREGKWEASYLPIHSNGQVAGILVIAANKTLEHELAETKEESNRLVRRILDGLFTFVGILSLDGKIIDVNRSPLEAAGIHREDVIDKYFWDCYWWCYSTEVQSQLYDAFLQVKEGNELRYDVKVRMLDNALMDIDFMLAPLRDTNGVITHLIASANDISSRTLREQELMLSEARLRSVLEATADGLILVDEQGKITFANRCASSMFGYPQGGLDALFIEDLVPEKHRDEHKKYREKYQQDPSARSMGLMQELFAQRQDGSQFPVEVGLTPLMFAEGTRILATVIDVSQQKVIQSDLEKALKSKTALLNEVHHRVKNNLQVVSSLLNLQSRRIPEGLKSHFDQSQNRIKAMALIHQQLYEDSNFESINAIEYTKKLCRLIYEGHLTMLGKVSMDVQSESKSIDIKMDQALPFGLLINEIITNAIQHAFVDQEEGNIYINLNIVDNNILVTIEDDGAGIGDDFVLGQTQSLGFQLIPDLASQLEADLTFIKKPVTRFEILFPVII
ncbi:MAG: PAS domain S-box protein [Oleibacter sp.]|nr:PAS domain S-box protein [Thalassolituus sp.]